MRLWNREVVIEPIKVKILEVIACTDYCLVDLCICMFHNVYSLHPKAPLVLPSRVMGYVMLT